MLEKVEFQARQRPDFADDDRGLPVESGGLNDRTLGLRVEGNREAGRGELAEVVLAGCESASLDDP